MKSIVAQVIAALARLQGIVSMAREAIHASLVEIQKNKII